ncbi:hypothetical protein CVT26_012188 [Gymnopilus dilepis]|uniref:Beta-lactamase-related domain-containing protein n=1 Tax=Gymnopilus dilepis TaxID=231916 RepID=A0A409W9H7_9AGAR|nr:hypothetical protein CVT26_012188 [Gymnopilus dilepis]
MLSSERKQHLDELINEVAEGKNLPEFVVGVSNVDGEVYSYVGGKKTETSGSIDLDSIFWLGGETKLVTSLAGLILIEQGKLSMDTPLADYFPQLRNPIILGNVIYPTIYKPAETVLTVKHLLNHTSGLFYPKVADGTLGKPYTSKDGYLPGIPLKFEPGTDFAYGWSSDVLGFLIEKVTGQTLDEFLKENIFGPLGMNSSSFYLTSGLRERLIDLTYREKGGRLTPWTGQLQIIEQDPAKVNLPLGGIGLYSSVRDWLTLLRHILQIQAGKPVEHPIVTRETVQSIFSPALPEAGERSISTLTDLVNWGPNTQWSTAMALTTEDWPNRRKKGSLFWDGYTGCEFFVDPTKGIAVVLGIHILPWGDQELWNTV